MPPDRVNQPNVVLITTHDLGQHVGCYGVETVATPNIDGLAEDGVRFADACTTSPICSPARGSMLTGRYPQSNGLMGLTHQPAWWRLHDGEVTMPELLSEAGYETNLIGFQHVAPDPKRLGFDYVYSREKDAEETTLEAAEVFQSADDGRPFYAQIGFTEVHRSFDQGTYDEKGVYVPPYLEETEELRADLAAFQAEINYFDERVGELLNALEANGLREDTLIVLAADHGIPYSGAKGWCRSAGVEITLLMDGPGPAFEERDVVESLISNVDVLPTVCDAIDVPVPDRVQGVSFKNYLERDTDTPPRDAVFAQYTSAGDEARGILTEEYNLIRNFGAGRPIDYPVEAPPGAQTASPIYEPRPYAQLYDRRDDPHELDDIGDDHEEVVKQLSSRVLKLMASVDDLLLRGGVRYPYHEEAMHDLLTDGSGRI